MNVIELKKMIYAFLITKSSRVFDTEAPPKLAYPYIVYTLENSFTDTNQKREDFDLAIDIYDNNQFDATDIDALVSSIDGNGAISNATGLHRKHYYVASTLQADIYRTSRDTICEDDENIKHVQLTYEVMTYLN